MSTVVDIRRAIHAAPIAPHRTTTAPTGLGRGRPRAGTAGDLDVEWKADGACHGVDPDLFFVSTAPNDDGAAVREARAVCAGCNVVDACREYALAAREPFGIWGGLTVEERRAELRRRGRAARTGGFIRRVDEARARRLDAGARQAVELWTAATGGQP